MCIRDSCNEVCINHIEASCLLLQDTVELTNTHLTGQSNELTLVSTCLLYTSVHSTHRWIQISYTVVQERSLNLRIHLIATFAYRGAICILSLIHI